MRGDRFLQNDYQQIATKNEEYVSIQYPLVPANAL